MKFALITCSSLGAYTNNADSEDDLLLAFLRNKGMDIRFEVWTDDQVDWKQYDWLLIKSPWDYFDRIEAFYQWLDRLEDLPVKVLNPTTIVRWNADKSYLKDIELAGIPVIPTLWIEKGQAFEAETFFSQLQTDHLIVKPRVSGGAKNTFSIRRSEVGQYTEKLNALFQAETFMAQPFLPEIQTKGEWSFLFFKGVYSHCVLKTSREGDFRVQHYLGGSIHPKEAPPYLLAQATRVVEQFASDCLYARVDGVEIDGKLWLMELELIEPFLFLFTHPQSMDNYHRALCQLTEVSFA
jgi:glutathione synthase/RimK-type ligase-like ATP-grasp enzyme